MTDLTGVAVRDDTAVTLTENDASPAVTELIQWAHEARQAHQIAMSLARTSFVPQSLRCTDRSLEPEQRDMVTAGNITAAILTGNELGMRPMAALRSMDIIYGTPALRAHTMRGLLQSHGHDIEPVVQTDERVVWRGRRKGSTRWVEVEWTIDRAKKLGAYDRNEQYRLQSKTMLNARATGELSRIIAADVLLGLPYAAEEIDVPRADTPAGASPVTADEITGRRQTPAAASERTEETERAVEQERTVEQERAEPREQPPVRPPAAADERRERNRLHAILGGFDLNAVKRRDDKLALLSDLAGHPVGSTDDMTADEVHRAVGILTAIQRGADANRPLAIAKHVEAGRKLRSDPPAPSNTPDTVRDPVPSNESAKEHS